MGRHHSNMQLNEFVIGLKSVKKKSHGKMENIGDDLLEDLRYKEVQRLGAGRSFGEDILRGDETSTRKATIRAEANTHLAIIDTHDFTRCFVKI